VTQRIGALSLFALGVNGIVGVGIFFTPNLLAGIVPGAVSAWVFPVTALLLLPIAVTFAWLGRLLPVDGGPYVWAESAFGGGAAFAVGWIAAVSALLSTAAVIAGLRDHLAPALGVPLGPMRVFFVWACVGLLSLVVSLGLRPSAFTWDILTALKVLPLLLLLGLGLLVTLPSATTAASPVVASSPADFRRALLVAMFPLQGFEAVPVLAGSVRRSRGGLALATIGCLLFAASLYTAIQLTCVRALPDLSLHQAPLTRAAQALGGALAASVVAAGTMLSAVGTAFGMVVVTPRYVAALGSESGLGAWLGRYDGKGVPRLALLSSALLVGVLASVQALGSLFALSSASVLAQYAMAIASLLRLVGKGRAPRLAALPACLGLLAIALLVKAVEAVELLILGGALLLGIALALGRALGRRVP
jgi:amino acid transporter